MSTLGSVRWNAYAIAGAPPPPHGVVNCEVLVVAGERRGALRQHPGREAHLPDGGIIDELGRGGGRGARGIGGVVGLAVAVVVGAVAALEAAGPAGRVVGLGVRLRQEAAGVVGVIDLAVAVVVAPVAARRVRRVLLGGVVGALAAEVVRVIDQLVAVVVEAVRARGSVGSGGGPSWLSPHAAMTAMAARAKIEASARVGSIVEGQTYHAIARGPGTARAAAAAAAAATAQRGDGLRAARRRRRRPCARPGAGRRGSGRAPCPRWRDRAVRRTPTTAPRRRRAARTCGSRRSRRWRRPDP